MENMYIEMSDSFILKLFLRFQEYSIYLVASKQSFAFNFEILKNGYHSGFLWRENRKTKRCMIGIENDTNWAIGLQDIQIFLFSHCKILTFKTEAEGEGLWGRQDTKLWLNARKQ